MATYQSVTTGDRIVTTPHVERAHRALMAADLLHEKGFHADAVVRAHQSVVHGERALLSTEKRSPTTVWSVHRLATNHFLGNGQIPAEHLERIEAMARLRSHIDDQPEGEVTADEAREALDHAHAFGSDVEAWLKANGYGGGEGSA
jgi:uncharacterized protein (UPF0332 family)